MVNCAGFFIPADPCVVGDNNTIVQYNNQSIFSSGIRFKNPAYILIDYGVYKLYFLQIHIITGGSSLSQCFVFNHFNYKPGF
jgi:hypothetical protein